MTNYTVYVKQVRQPIDSSFPGGSTLIEIGSTETDDPEKAIKKIGSRYSPEEYMNDLNIHEDEGIRFVAIAESNESEEVARISRNGENLEFGKTW